MPYERKIRVYESDASTVASVGTNGYIQDMVVAGTFGLGARRGCLGGSLSLAGDIETNFLLEQGQIVKFYHGAAVVYAGEVQGPSRTIDGTTHDYELRGWWGWLEKIKVTAREVYDGESPEDIAQDIYSNYISGQVPFIASTTFDASGQTVGKFRLEIGKNITSALETLSFLATTAGARFCCGIDGDGDFYFTAIGEVTPQATFTIGTDAVKGSELRSSKLTTGNSIIVTGGTMPSNVTETTSRGLSYRKRYLSGAPEIIDQSIEWEMEARELYQESDVLKFAGGFFVWYADRIVFDDLTRAELLGGDPIYPWIGLIEYVDRNGLAIGTEPAEQVAYSFGSWMQMDVNIAQDDFTPGLRRDVLLRQAGPIYRRLQRFFPPATNLSPPEYQPAFTPLPLNEETGAAEPSAGTPRGSVVAWETDPAVIDIGATINQTVYSTIKVGNGGTALAADAVELHYRILNASGGVVATSSNACTRLGTEDSEETWSDDTGVTSGAAGKVLLAVKVITATGPEISKIWPWGSGGTVDWDYARGVNVLSEIQWSFDPRES